MDMIIFEESGQITPDMWDAVRRYDKSGGWPAVPMSKDDIIRRRLEGEDMWWNDYCLRDWIARFGGDASEVAIIDLIPIPQTTV